MASQTGAKGTPKKNVSNLVIINNPLQVVLRVHMKAEKILLNSSSSVSEILCATLTLQRVFQKFKDKISKKNMEALQKRVFLLYSYEVVDQIIRRKDEISLQNIEVLGAVLRRVPTIFWMEDLPMMRFCAEA